MFRVDASSLEEYFAFDPDREGDLRQVDEVIRAAAPSLERWFVSGASDGAPGMQMNLIGYGEFHFTVTTSPTSIRWPALGLALQKNYLSLYCPASNADVAFTIAYANRLGKIGLGSTGAIRFANARVLDLDGLAAMAHDLERGINTGTVTLRYGESVSVRRASAGPG